MPVWTLYIFTSPQKLDTNNISDSIRPLAPGRVRHRRRPGGKGWSPAPRATGLSVLSPCEHRSPHTASPSPTRLGPACRQPRTVARTQVVIPTPHSPFRSWGDACFPGWNETGCCRQVVPGPPPTPRTRLSSPLYMTLKLFPPLFSCIFLE